MGEQWNKDPEQVTKKQPQGKKIEISGETLYLEHKPDNEHSGSGTYDFVVKYWSEPMGESAGYNLSQGLKYRTHDVLRNENDEIIGVSVYPLGLGELELAVVRPDYRKRGIAGFLAALSVDAMIAYQLKQHPQALPVIDARARTKEGAALLQQLAKKYSGKMTLKVWEQYKEIREDNLPMGLEAEWHYDYGDDFPPRINEGNVNSFVETICNQYPDDQRDQRRKALHHALKECLREEETAICVLDDQERILAMSGYQHHGKNEEEQDVIELLWPVADPARSSERLDEILLYKCQDKVDERFWPIIFFVSGDPHAIEIALDRGYREIPLQEYVAKIPNTKFVGPQSLGEKTLRAFVKEEVIPYKTYTP